MKIAIAQLNYTVGDLSGNKAKIVDAIRKAKENGAELAVFAEHAISGTNCYDLINKIPFLEACQITLKEIAIHCDGISAIVGVPIIEGEDKISAAALLQDKKIVKYVGKKVVMSRNEKVFFSPSAGVENVNINDKRVAIAVGEDLIPKRKFGNNVDVVISIQAHPYYRGIIAQRYQYFSGIAYEDAKPVVFVNHFGGQSEIIYDGSSCAYNKEGKAIALLKNFEEDFVVVDTESSDYKEEPEQVHTENVYKAIKLGLQDYFTKNGFKKACLGLSGGIDSAVVLALAADVLGAENIRVLMMPSQFSTEHSVDDAIEMAQNLGVEFDVIPIKETYNVLLDSLKPIIGGTKFDVTEENLQARIRCDMLMALANKFGYILLNTSNKSEASMGYGTLYGDLAGSISPIGDLYKNEVYGLARYINRYVEIIPKNIIAKEPSAELRPGQKDSDSLPPYEVLDSILYRFIEEGQSVSEILGAGFDLDMVRFILEKIKVNEYKRRQCCPAFRLSMRPYGSEFILPLLNKFLLVPR